MRERAKLLYLVYKNARTEVKPYEVSVAGSRDHYLYVFDHRADRLKCFIPERILSKEDSYEEAVDVAKRLQKGYELRRSPRVRIRIKAPRTQMPSNPDGVEVCFTGFSAAEKAGLIKKAKQHKMVVRPSVTTYLDLLVCGETAGWRKVETASQGNVQILSGADEFETFLATHKQSVGTVHDADTIAKRSLP